MMVIKSRWIMGLLLLWLCGGCQSQSRTALNPTPISSAKTEIATSISPKSLVALPASITAPPRAFTAATGRILLPPSWAVSADIFRQLKLQVGQTVFPASEIFYDTRVESNGFLTTAYVVSPIPLNEKKQISLLSKTENSVLLRAWLSHFEESGFVIQDLTAETSALAVVKEQNPILSLFTIANSPLLPAVTAWVENILANQDKPNVSQESTLIGKAKQVASALQSDTRQVMDFILNPSVLNLTVGQSIKMGVQVRFTDGTTSQRIKWSALTPDIALVSSEGVISGFKAGTAIFKAKALADLTREVVVTVQVTDSQLSIAANPIVETLSPSPIPIGDEATIKGSGWLANAVTVRLGNSTIPIKSSTDTTILFQIPAGVFGSQSLTVQSNGRDSSPFLFHILPTIATLSQGKVRGGDTLEIHGSGFSPNPSENTIRLGNTTLDQTKVQLASLTQLTIKVPEDIPVGVQQVTVSVASQQSKGISVNMLEPLPGVVLQSKSF